jgi:hypothetical protein
MSEFIQWVKTAVEKASDNYVFEPNTTFQQLNISDRNCVAETWEDVYPFMPERLLAIEAHDLYETTIYGDDLPIHLQKYPYKKIWSIKAVYSDGRKDWLPSVDESPDFTDTDSYPTVESGPPNVFLEEIQLDKSVELPVRYESFPKWELRIPGYIVYLAPAKPVKYISFTAVINRLGADFSSVE